MSAFDDLKIKLREIFQLDHNELDFGLYRIMKLKANEISNFIENDLLKEVKDGLAEYTDNDRTKIQQEIETKSKQIKESGLNPDDSPVIKQLKEQLKSTTSSQDIETEIYSNLYDFFKRYYEGGDFLSLRRYKKDVYALPYEGEEVKLHWANADQYYIKSSETLTNYTFILKNKEKVRFEVVEANTEQNNNKGDRYFKLATENTVRKEGNEYIVSFTYLPYDEKLNQKTLNEEIAKVLLENTVLSPVKEELNQLVDKENKVPLILKHITDFTAKNQFDYFIHKDLGGFLNRELDFYIKNEIMQIDDIENQSLENVNKYLGKIKVFRKVAHKIIQFLASLENFQKKIWLKKKLILETNYCITLDRVPEQLYSKIIENKAQIQEWIKLFAINEIKQDLSTVGYSEPLTIDFLKDNPYLVLDTAFFDNDFKYELLSNIDNIDEQCNGLLINSENFQALNLLQEKYNQKVKCVYIDPPYNTSEETFVYKNLYKHSSWISMMSSRIALSKSLFSENSLLMVAIDDEELYNLKKMLDIEMGSENYISTIVVQSNPRGRSINSFYATSHDYCLCYAKNPTELEIVDSNLTEEQADDFKHEGEKGQYRMLPFRRSGGYSTPEERPNSEFPLYFNKQKQLIAVGGEKNKSDIVYMLSNNGELLTINKKDFLNKNKDIIEIMPVDTSGVRRVWRWSDRYKILQSGFCGDLVLQCNDKGYYVQLKDYIKEGRKAKTIWYDSKYDASSHGTNLLKNLLGERHLFGYPKSIDTVYDSLYTIVGNDDSKNSIILDFFAGSGTTGQAVTELNKQDNGNRKYILVEVEKYFDSVTKPRIEKVIYSEDWKDGKPVSRQGSSHCFKYIRLESYEDCLDNLKFSNSQATLPQEVKQDYMLNYMLDLETKDSLLNIKDFNNPFDYKLKITRNGETKEVTVDLVETFNYLLGLTVESIQKIRDVIKIEGKTKLNERALIIWRDLTKTDNQKLNEWFNKINDSTKSSEFDVIYVNGDNNLENLRKKNDTWKVRLIEESFLKRMFDIKDC